MEDISRVRQVIARLRKERDRWENWAMRVGPILEGSLVEQYTVCGKPGCKCSRGEKHGPYWYLSQKVEGRTKMRYVPKAEVRKVRVLVRRYRELREARQRIRELTGQIEGLLDKIEERQRVRWGEGK